MASRELGQRHAGDRELVRRNDPLTYMQSQINRIFDDFLGRQPLAGNGSILASTRRERNRQGNPSVRGIAGNSRPRIWTSK
jgi:hypothetical protein